MIQEEGLLDLSSENRRGDRAAMLFNIHPKLNLGPKIKRKTVDPQIAN